MHVVLGVAFDALFVRIVKRRRRVAVFADDLGVSAEQREARQIVVETQAARPRELGVARSAIVAELHLVRIILGMAADAFGRR